MKFIVLDTETDLIDKTHNVPGQFRLLSYTKPIALKDIDEGSATDVLSFGHTYFHWRELLDLFIVEPTLIVGHNIGYDVKVIMRLLNSSVHLRQFFKSITLWDTAYVHYLMTGQQHLYPSLNDVAAFHHLGTKDDAVKRDYWDKGKDTWQVPQDLLIQYCEQDVRLTTEIFKKQFRAAMDEDNIFPTILSHMSAMKATVAMEYVGMPFEAKDALQYQLDVVSPKADAFKSEVKKTMSIVWPKEVPPNPESTKQLKLFLYGGTLKYSVREPVGVYKSGPKKGETRYRVDKRSVEIPNFIPKSLLDKYHDTYDTNSDTLQQFKGHDIQIDKVIDNILSMRKWIKEKSTYFDAYRTRSLNNRIYPSINHTGTVTSRLSSSNPNLQNVTRKDT